MRTTRRGFLAAAAVASISGRLPAYGAGRETSPLSGEVGITTGSFSRQLRDNPQKFQLPGLLTVIRDELQMRVVDVYTPSLASFQPAYLEEVRAAAERTGCVLTNLKMNQPGLNLGSRDKDARQRAIAEYQRGIDAAARLGMRWARPLPAKTGPDRAALVAGLRELRDYATARGVQLLIENFGWMQSDPNSAVGLIEEVGGNVAASPDTGNWANNEVRYEGLAKTFPRAVTCDFKARTLTADDQHAEYDLKRCFTIGWDAGFRGPWCLEHGHADEQTLYRNLRRLRDLLREWIAEQA